MCSLSFACRIWEPLGDHRSACAQSGLRRSRGGPLERAAARICREAGARVTTNTRVADLNIPSVHLLDDRRMEVIANGLPLWGGASWLSTPLLSLLSHGKGSPDGGTGGMRGLLGCPPQQGASLPRTRCQWPLPFSGFGLRNWRSLGPRNVHLSTPPRKSPGKTSPTNPPASGVHSSPAPLVCHADSRSSYCLRSIPARVWWCQWSQRRGHSTLLQRASRPDPARTPTSQPTSSPSHLTGFCHLGTGQVKNCQPWTCGTSGDKPEEKLPSLTELLQQKGAEKKNMVDWHVICSSRNTCTKVEMAHELAQEGPVPVGRLCWHWNWFNLFLQWFGLHMRWLHQASSQNCFLGFFASVKQSLLWTRLRNSQPSAGITQKFNWRCSCNCHVIMYHKWLIFHVQLDIWRCLDFITCFHFRNLTLLFIPFWRKGIFILEIAGFACGKFASQTCTGLACPWSHRTSPPSSIITNPSSNNVQRSNLEVVHHAMSKIHTHLQNQL